MKKSKVLGVSVNDYGGDGIPLIFVHSFPLSSKMWDRQVEYFKDKYRVITFDTRGLGESTTEDNVYSMEKLVNDFFHILNNLKVQKVNACGLSMGGYILLRAILKDSERFNSLILVNTKTKKDDDEVILKRSSAVIKIQSGGREAYLQKLLPKLISTDTPDLERLIKNIISENSDEGICGNILALSTRTNTTDKLKELNIPLLLLSGKDDKINSDIETDDMFRLLRENRKHTLYTALIKMNDCGHLCNIEKPEEFNKILDWFLKGIEISS
ncbi:MAG: alpha/beta fold hydrolase [Ignavibacteria bacterium]